MSKIKDLLNEHQIRRFMKLAEISSFAGETEELEESTEVTEEAEELEESTEVTEEAEELEEGGLAARREKGLNDSQVRELVQRTQKRLAQESRKARRLAEREKRVRAVEAQMVREIEVKRAAENSEALIENLVSRVVGRLKNLKGQ